MRIDWWTLGLQVINVLILVWLLQRFLYRPVLDMIAARQAMANKLLDEAEAAKKAAAEELAALTARSQAEANERETHRADMRASVEIERAQLFDQAKLQVDTLAKQAAAAVAAEQIRVAVEFEDKAALLAGTMAEKLLGRLPANGVTDAMFAALLERISALPEESRSLLARESPLTIATPAAVTPDRRDRYLSALAAALPDMVAPDFIVDPALIGGLELRGPHVLVRNSWRADLDGFLAALKRDPHARLG